jgi:hypothetical protein
VTKKEMDIMAITVPLFNGREFADLNVEELAALFAKLPAAVVEGELIDLPEMPENYQLLCLFRQSGRERLALMTHLQDAKDIQSYPCNSDFRWYGVNPDTIFADMAVA